MDTGASITTVLPNMSEIFVREKDKGEEFTLLEMEDRGKGNGQTTSRMGKVDIRIKMAKLRREYGKKDTSFRVLKSIKKEA